MLCISWFRSACTSGFAAGADVCAVAASQSAGAASRVVNLLRIRAPKKKAPDVAWTSGARQCLAKILVANLSRDVCVRVLVGLAVAALRAEQRAIPAGAWA